MNRPQPKKHAECEHCLTVKPLLMPVSFIPGWPIVVWNLLCVACRMQVQFSRHRDRYCEPGDMWKFSASRQERNAYDDWLPVETL